MATGRTVGAKYTRAYVDGYDLSGYARSVGELGWDFEPNEIITLADAVKGALPGHCNISIGGINAVLETNTGTNAMHDIFRNGGDAVRDVMIPLGIRAAPAAGDPVFCAQVSQNSYQVDDPSGGVVTVNMGLGNQDVRNDSTGNYKYSLPWGVMVAEKMTSTGANTGEYDYDYGDTGSTYGGYMMYHLFTSSTGVTLKIQDSPTSTGWSDLVSSGVINASTTPAAAVEVLGCTGTVDEYLRWQIDMGAATTATFAIAFVRGRRFIST